MTKNPTSGARDTSDRVRRSRLLRLVPDSGLVDDLVARVAELRAQRIELLPVEVGPGLPTGVWIAFPGFDYIVFPADASSSERTAIICHELAHMLLGHQDDPAADHRGAWALLSAPDPERLKARQVLARHGYVDGVEAEAEQLATLLVARLDRHARADLLRRDAVSDRLR